MHDRNGPTGSRRRATGFLAGLCAVPVLAGCSGATDSDATNVAVCRAVPQQRDVLLGQLEARPQDTGAIRAGLDALSQTLEVRDTDASDQMRGDALIVQLNLATTRRSLDRGDAVDTAHLRYVFDTFWSRECDRG